jgi:hypothetical protein
LVSDSVFGSVSGSGSDWALVSGLDFALVKDSALVTKIGSGVGLRITFSWLAVDKYLY